LSTHPELTASHMALHSTSSLKACDLVSHRHERTFLGDVGAGSLADRRAAGAAAAVS
jgi:hypothetical protein